MDPCAGLLMIMARTFRGDGVMKGVIDHRGSLVGGERGESLCGGVETFPPSDWWGQLSVGT